MAGGRAQRMGGDDKGLLELAGKPMISYVLNRLRPQVDTTLINANRNIARYKEFGAAVISDTMADFQGPLAGMSIAMQVARTPYIVTVPCDSPFVPQDYVQRMFDGLVERNAVVATATDGDRWQPVFSLIETHLYDDLIVYLKSGERKIDLWFKKHAVVAVNFSDQTEAFLNINTPEDKAKVEKILLETNL